MRSAISSFLARIQKTAHTQTAPTHEGLEASQKPRNGDTIYRLFHELSWTRWQQFEIYAASAILTCSAAIVWLSVFAISRNEPIEIHPERNAQELIQAGFGKNTVNQDQVAKFIIDTLTLLHRIDDNGSPYLPLLRGYVNTDVYDQIEAYISKNARQFQQHGIVQNLNVTRVLNVIQDNENGRISAYVRGYYSIFKDPKGQTTEVQLIPYRARVKLETNIRSQVNNSDFYLFELREATGEDAKKWDIEEETI